MSVYFVTLIVVCLLGYIAEKYGISYYDDENYLVCKESNKIIIVMIIGVLSFLYTFRWRVGTDFWGYYYDYSIYGMQSLSELVGQRDWGFSILVSIIYKICPNNYHFYTFILSLLTYVPVITTFGKYSKKLPLTLFLYLTTLSCFWPYNGVRQSIAGSICFGAYGYLCDKKYIKYTVCVLVASLFHATAVIMIPMLFFVRLKSWKKPMLIVSAALLASIVFLGNIWSYIIQFLNDVGQAKMASDYGEAIISSGGVNILRILVSMVPVVLACIYYNRNNMCQDEKMDMLTNMSVLSAIFMIAAYRLTVLARFSNYFGFAIPLIYCEFEDLFAAESKKIYVFGLAVFFIVYMYMVIQVDGNLVPYSFSFG